MGLVKGLTRMSMLLLLVVASMFKPQACMFPDGKESWDSAHVCFACYVAERVENDKIVADKWREASSKLKQINVMARASQRADSRLAGKKTSLGVSPTTWGVTPK